MEVDPSHDTVGTKYTLPLTVALSGKACVPYRCNIYCQKCLSWVKSSEIEGTSVCVCVWTWQDPINVTITCCTSHGRRQMQRSLMWHARLGFSFYRVYFWNSAEHHTVHDSATWHTVKCQALIYSLQCFSPAVNIHRAGLLFCCRWIRYLKFCRCRCGRNCRMFWPILFTIM